MSNNGQSVKSNAVGIVTLMEKQKVSGWAFPKTHAQLTLVLLIVKAWTLTALSPTHSPILESIL